jgi:hypothetical protein
MRFGIRMPLNFVLVYPLSGLASICKRSCLYLVCQEEIASTPSYAINILILIFLLSNKTF